jgi:hypothetical protein
MLFACGMIQTIVWITCLDRCRPSPVFFGKFLAVSFLYDHFYHNFLNFLFTITPYVLEQMNVLRPRFG